MEIKITETGIFLNGAIEDRDLKANLETSENPEELLKAFLEIVQLGTRVREAIQTTTTAQILANSVETVQENLTELEEEHELFIRNLMKEIVAEDSTSDIGFVKKLSDWSNEFDSKLDDEFDSSRSDNTISKIKSALEKHLADRDAQIARLLSLESHPTEARPLKAVLDKAQEIFEKLTEDKGAKKSTKGNAKKGNDFEACVFSIISSLADEFGDSADDTGKQKKPGVSGSHEGDIVVDFVFDSVGAKTGRLVLECKYSLTDKTSSRPKLLTELNPGISNREADYGILVTNENNFAASGSFPFWEDLGNRRSILVLEDDFEELNADKVRFAYLVAKARIHDMKLDLDADKLEQVQSQIAMITTNFGRIRQLKGSHTQAVSALGDIKTTIDFLEENVGKHLEELNMLLTGPNLI